MQLPTINAFWIGRHLGPIAIACLHSFVRAGHRVKLHVYEAPLDVSSKVELVDAAKLMPLELVQRHRRSQSYALASDLFRYEIQAAGLGIYVDCDCYCIQPLEASEYLMGLEDPSHICTAVLHLPSDSPLLADLRQIGQSKAFVPPWLKSKKRRWYRLRARMGFPVSIAEMPWGTAGPLALTYFARKHGVFSKAVAPDILYGLPKIYSDLLIEPDLMLKDFTTSRTKVIHLWNEYSRHLVGRAPPGSPLARIIEEGSAVSLA